MKRRMLVGLFVGIMLMVSLGYMSESTARVNVGIGVNIQLPQVMLPGPPEVVVIPGTYVYFVPDIHENIFFYRGYWYRPYEEYWYRSKGYNGPWGYIRPAKVPSALINLPQNYRHVPKGYKNIPHRELKKNWRTWESNRYWDSKGRQRPDTRQDDLGRQRRDGRSDSLEPQEEGERRRVY